MRQDHIQAFLDVLDHGSFQGAARETGVPRGTLRTRIEALEKALGTPLVIRGSDGVAPTEAGRLALPYLRSMVQTDADLRRDLEQHALGHAGELKVVSFEGGEPMLVSTIVRGARALVGGAQLDVEFDADPLAAASLETDLVIHLGDPPTDPRWYSRVIRRMPLGLVASPAYLAERGTPASIDALADHDLMLFRGPAWPHARLPTPSGPRPCQPAVRSSDIDLLRWMAAMGHGIALVPDGDVPETLGRPPVVPVLRDQVSTTIVMRASTRNRALPRVQVILDAFDQAMPEQP